MQQRADLAGDHGLALAVVDLPVLLARPRRAARRASSLSPRLVATTPSSRSDLARPLVVAERPGLRQRPVQQLARRGVLVEVGQAPAALHERVGLQVGPVRRRRARSAASSATRRDGGVLAAEEQPPALGEPGPGPVRPGRSPSSRGQLVERGPLLVAAAQPVEHGLAGEQHVAPQRALVRRAPGRAARPNSRRASSPAKVPAACRPARRYQRAAAAACPGLLVVVGDRRRVLVGPLAAPDGLLQPLGGQRVVRPADRPQHALVGDVAHERVPEGELVAAGEGRVRPLEDDLARRASRSSAAPPGRRRHRRGQPGDRLVPEHPAHHRGAADDRCARRRSSESSRACSSPRRVRGHAQVPAHRPRDPPAVGGGVDDALLDEPLDQLLDVERVAVGGADDQLAPARPARRRPAAGSRATRRRRVVLASSGASRQPGVHRRGPRPRTAAAPAASGRAVARTSSGPPPGRAGQAPPASRGWRRRPSAGPRAGRPRAPARPAGPAAAAPGALPRRRSASRVGGADGRPARPRRARTRARWPPSPARASGLSAPPSSSSQPSTQRRRTRSGSSVARMPSRSAKTLRSRPFGHVLGGRRRPAAQHPHVGREPGQPRLDVVHEPGLADPRLAEHRDDPPGPLARRRSAKASCSCRSSGSRPTVRVTTPSTPRVSGQKPSRSPGDDDERVDGPSMPLSCSPATRRSPNDAAHLAGGVRGQQDGRPGRPRPAAGRPGWRCRRRPGTRRRPAPRARSRRPRRCRCRPASRRRTPFAASTSALSCSSGVDQRQRRAHRAGGVVLP